ncbi:MAG: NAD(P)H-hydrate dehydratase [Deltaproteobacteria bacterium]|nr:NAD(P)H-hydrate dehydratase [Deltaproteobacteria bacterium]
MKRATEITPALLRRWRLPALDSRLGKVARGKVLVVGGSDEIPGAAILAATAALRAGAGTLVIATSATLAVHVAVAVPEARVIGLRTTRAGELAKGAVTKLREVVDGCDAVLIGPGMRDPRAGQELLAAAKRSPALFVVDAGGLDGLSNARAASRPVNTVITPHAGEMARLLDIGPDEVLATPQAIAIRAAEQLRVIVVLKGPVTYVAAPDGTCLVNRAGNLGLGTSGSGDTLAGVIAGLGARGASPIQAAAWAIHVHAKAGDVLARSVGPLGYLARELLDEIPRLVGTYAKAPRRNARRSS